MTMMRIALWGPLFVAGLLVGAYIYIHDPFARDGTDLLQVPLSEADPALDRVGELRYLGGLDIPRMEQNIGGLSGLEWHSETGVLLAITDDARWVWFDLKEVDGRLTGLARAPAVAAILDADGGPLSGKEEGDSESLARDSKGNVLVSFERDHRIISYIGGPVEGFASPSTFDPKEQLGELEENRGIEAMAVAGDQALLCAERAAIAQQANCILNVLDTDTFSDFPVRPPDALGGKGAVPTAADALSDGTFLILFRSYSPAKGNTAAIVAYAPDGSRREIATFLPPLTVDNFEGLAVREEGDRTFIYIVSDDNFSGSQRTLLMKFELVR